MGNVIKAKAGSIVISKEVIALLAGMAVIECYGIVGMASGKMKDGIDEVLKRENVSRGVVVNISDNYMTVQLNVIVGYGTKMSEVAQNVIEKVKYTVENLTGLRIGKVYINVKGVRVI